MQCKRVQIREDPRLGLGRITIVVKLQIVENSLLSQKTAFLRGRIRGSAVFSVDKTRIIFGGRKNDYQYLTDGNILVLFCLRASHAPFLEGHSTIISV